MDIKVRNVDPVAIKKIDELAKAKGISRNEYLKKYISQIAAMKEMKEVENKYSNLVNAVVDRLEQANDVIRENSMLFENIRDKY
jgi:hypothetical protein